MVDSSAVALPLSRWETLSDRLNPILVREVRQGLRGRSFRNLFLIVLVIAAVTSIGILVTAAIGDRSGTSVGENLYRVSFGTLHLALTLYVPFAAFQTVAGEWEEGTRDLLSLTRIGPGSVVSGKLLGTFLQALLLLAAFVPFAVFAFLLRGIDLWRVIVDLNGEASSCATLTMIAIALAAFGRDRTSRIFLLALLGGIVLFGGGSVFFLFRSRAMPVVAGSSLSELVSPWLGTLTIGAFGFVIARNRFTHREENRSTPLRVVMTLILVVAIVLFGLIRATGGAGLLGLQFWTTMICIAFYGCCVVFVAEPLPLGRRTAAGLSRRKGFATALAPWLPGGMRGLLYFVLHVPLVVLLGVLANPLRTSSLDGGTLPKVAMGLAYTACILGLASLLLMRSKRGAGVRTLVVIGSWVVPLGVSWFVAVFTSIVPLSLGMLEGVLEVVNVVPSIFTAGDGSDSWIGRFFLVSGIGLVLLVLHVRGMIASIHEVRVAARRSAQAPVQEAAA